MNYRTLDLKHSKVLTNPRIFDKYNHVYTVVSVTDKAGMVQKFKTTWNKPMKFIVNEAALLVVKIKAKRMFVDKKLGEVRVPVKELMEGVTSEGNYTVQTMICPVKGRSGESMGDLTFCYEFGKRVYGEAKKNKKSVTTYPMVGRVHRVTLV
ncbi:protein SRC2-like [Bidens hawaiensis]|uniref:protein SRC2-like n=1 Tax=Bidens hawaiensis TaxID=980011 RepID=UPI0040493CDA